MGSARIEEVWPWEILAEGHAEADGTTWHARSKSRLLAAPARFHGPAARPAPHSLPIHHPRAPHQAVSSIAAFRCPQAASKPSCPCERVADGLPRRSLCWKHGPERTDASENRWHRIRLCAGYLTHPHRTVSVARQAHLVDEGPRPNGICRPSAGASQQQTQRRSSRRTPASRWFQGPMRQPWSTKPAAKAKAQPRARDEGLARFMNGDRFKFAVHGYHAHPRSDPLLRPVFSDSRTQEASTKCRSVTHRIRNNKRHTTTLT